MKHKKYCNLVTEIGATICSCGLDNYGCEHHKKGYCKSCGNYEMALKIKDKEIALLKNEISRLKEVECEHEYCYEIGDKDKQISRYREALEKIAQDLCPQCGGQGWYQGTETIRGEDGLPEPSPCQIQCDCYRSKIGFMVNLAKSALQNEGEAQKKGERV